MPDWTRDYFERGYAQRWGLPAPSDHVRLEANGLYHLLELSPTSRVIDIGCGHGRYAVALAERGPDVIGLDFAVALLNRARHLTAGPRTQVRWIRGDMRRLPFRSECAGAAIVMDAFGFFDTEDEHEAVLREAARVLTTSGHLGLKVVNGGPVLDNFREREREERNGTVVLVSRTLTLDPPESMNDVSACTESRSCAPLSNTPGSPSWVSSHVQTVRHSNQRCRRRCGSSVGDAPSKIGLG